MNLPFRSKNVTVPLLMQDQERERVVYILTIVCITIIGGLFVMLVERMREGNSIGFPPIIAMAFIMTGVFLRMRKSPVVLSGSLIVWSLAIFLEYEAWCNDGICNTAVIALPGVSFLRVSF